MRQLTNNVVVITGATRGIGAGIARALAAEGARLVLVARKKADLDKVAKSLKLPSDHVVTVAADVSRAAGMRKIIDTAFSQLGRVDIFINNAGIGHTGPISKMTEKQFDDLMATNLKSVFLCFRELIPRFEKQGHGQIINISSMAGRQAVPNMAGYAASKAALNILSESVGGEVRNENIKISVLAPASTDTGFGSSGARSIAGTSGGKRKLTVEEVAEAVVFMARQNENVWMSMADMRPLIISKK